MKDEKLIVICSKNKAKNDAVISILNNYVDEFRAQSLETKSGVSETPIGDEEGITGCHNRIKDALNQEPNGFLYVAMEGILSKTSFGVFICGWTVIYNKELNEYYYGCSSKVKVPDEIVANISPKQRLSDIVARYIKSTDDEVSNYGTNGILTNGSYTRTDEFKDSVMCAISSKFKRINGTKEK